MTIYLFVWVHIDMAFDALLTHVGPGIAAHPFSLAFGTFILPEAAFLPLIRCQAFAPWPGLQDAQFPKIPSEKRMHS